LSVDRIAEAAAVVDPVFTNSPEMASPGLDERLGCSLITKIETINPIRSFKGRGADFFVHRLAAAGGVQPTLACASAGNFGQGLAYAGRRHGFDVHVFTAASANPLKIAAMRRLGATVHAEGDDFDSAKDSGRLIAAREGWSFVEDGDEPSIAEGAGTIGWEMTRDRAGGAPYDTVFIPVGNGALAGGVGTWLRSASPRTRIIGVCAAGAPSMWLSWQQGRPISTDAVDTIADGIAVRVPVPAAVDDLAGILDDMILVDDSTIRAAVSLVTSELGLLAEPAGAAGVAGVLELQPEMAGQLVGTILCGSNVPPGYTWESSE
jgi:threonine dehydratase